MSDRVTDATQSMLQEQIAAFARQVPLGRNGLPADVAGATLKALHPCKQIELIGRNGLPADVAGATLLLASEQANFITGAYLLSTVVCKQLK